MSNPRCPDCGAWQSPIGLNDWTCSNARCGSSWQAARRDFEGSMLGAAIRQLQHSEQRPNAAPDDGPATASAPQGPRA